MDGPRAPIAGTHAPCGWFLLRAAMLPAGLLDDWQRGVEAPDAADGPELAAALERDRARLRAALDALLDRPDLRRGLELGSDSVAAALAEPSPRDRRRERALERTLVAYLSRACSRPAPFGLFGGVGLGRLGDETALAVPPDDEHRVVHRIAVDAACELAAALAADPELARAVRYTVAPTLTRAPGGRVRVLRQKPGGEDGRHEVATFTLTAPLRTLLDAAAEGATAEELVAALGGAETFVARAIERGLLVATLDPPVTGPDPLEHLLAEVERIDGAGARAAELRELAAALERLTSFAEALRPERAAALRAAAARLPGPPRGEAALLRVVRAFPGEGLSLGPAPMRLVEDAAGLLLRVGSTGWPDVLGALRERFVARFALREVPLADVFDDEVGLGRDAFERIEAEWRADPPGERDRHLLALALDAAAEGRREVELSGHDLEALESGGTLEADSASVLVSLAAASPAAAAAGDADVLAVALGLEAPRMVARFADALPELEPRLAELAALERRHAPGALVADVVLRHGTRVGNVLQRPRVHEWEIELLGRSGAPAERRLGLDDLLLSVRDGGFRLRSRHHGVPVEPRQCSALMMDARRPAIARFLWMLGQRESGPAWAWTWGRALDGAPWLPRVRRGRVVLSLARWLVASEEAAALTRPADPAARFAALREWRRARGVPREVDLVELDRWIRLDLENVLCADVLLARLQRDGAAQLREAWPPAGGHGAVSGPGGGLAHELLVPLARVAPAPSGGGDVDAPADLAVALSERRRPPGSDWLLLELDGHPRVLERALAERLAPACAGLLESGVAARWFARLDAGPEPHLRLHLRGEPGALLNDALERLRSAVESELADGRIHRLALDTYERELERYGGPEGLDAAERVFQADSELLARLVGTAGERRHWLALVRAVGMLSALLGSDPAAWSAGLAERRDALLKRAKIDCPAAELFAGSPRSEARTAERWLAGEPWLPAEAAALADWRAATARPLAELRGLAPAQAAEGLLGGGLLAPGEPAHAAAQLLDALLRVARGRAARGRVSAAAGPRA